MSAYTLSVVSQSWFVCSLSPKQVPARAAAAAAVARALAGLPPHQRFNLSSSSEQLSAIYGSRPHGQVVEELEEVFYEEVLLSHHFSFDLGVIVSDTELWFMVLFTFCSPQ